jgi:hypothetical protein
MLCVVDDDDQSEKTTAPIPRTKHHGELRPDDTRGRGTTQLANRMTQATAFCIITFLHYLTFDAIIGM